MERAGGDGKGRSKWKEQVKMERAGEHGKSRLNWKEQVEMKRADRNRKSRSKWKKSRSKGFKNVSKCSRKCFFLNIQRFFKFQLGFERRNICGALFLY